MVALRYDPYGGSTTTNSSGFSASYENPYTFGEGLRDRATGEVKFGQRFCNPTTGTWTQQDTLNAPLDPANANRYEYAADNPINQVDPTGSSLGGYIFGSIFAGAAVLALGVATLGVADAIGSGALLVGAALGAGGPPVTALTAASVFSFESG